MRRWVWLLPRRCSWGARRSTRSSRSAACPGHGRNRGRRRARGPGRQRADIAGVLRADGEFTCAGTTLDNKPITVTVPDDQTQVMTIKIDGTQIFSGPVQEVIEKAGERTS